MDVDALLERAAERLLGDERLRGGLTDAGFGPLLDWAMDVLASQGPALVASASAPEQAMDEVAAALRDLVRSAVQTAETADPTAAVETLRRTSVVAGTTEAAERVGRLSLGADPDENARLIAAALMERN